MGERARGAGIRGAAGFGGLAALLAALALCGGCAAGRSAAARTASLVSDTRAAVVGAAAVVAGAANDAGPLLNGTVDEKHAWVSRKIADVADATDKAFGEPRVEDRERLVRARMGVKAGLESGEHGNYRGFVNFRIPLPALKRRTNIFLDYTSDRFVDDGSGVNTVTSYSESSAETESSFSAAVLKRVADNFDLVGRLRFHGVRDIGPEVSFRFEERWLPWRVFAEQQVFWRTRRHLGGKTGLDIDYQLDPVSYLRLGTEASYYQELHCADWTTGLAYRRPFFREAALSVEAGVKYNPYDGDPTEDGDGGGENDGDELFARVRMVGKVWRSWLEWEITPGYGYPWRHEDPGVWRLDLRFTILYEAYLSGPK